MIDRFAEHMAGEYGQAWIETTPWWRRVLNWLYPVFPFIGETRTWAHLGRS